MKCDADRGLRVGDMAADEQRTTRRLPLGTAELHRCREWSRYGSQRTVLRAERYQRVKGERELRRTYHMGQTEQMTADEATLVNEAR